MDQSGIGSVLKDKRTNALLAWLLVLFVLVVAGANLFTMDLLWAGFALVVAALALLPPLTYRDPTAMLPWEVLLLVVLPLLARTVSELARFRSDVAAYLSVAALALVVAVELHLLTPVEMNHRFAIGFVVVATMATAGVWAVVRYAADIAFGTTWLLPPGGTSAPVAALDAAERRLMLEFVASFLSGSAAGVVFEFYFRRRARGEKVIDADGEVSG